MLTRTQIDAFAAVASTDILQWQLIPAWMRAAGLFCLDRHGYVEITAAGDDLLATVPHLPAPEPEPVQSACGRCGDTREVPLFMGPLMMPCPACRPESSHEPSQFDIVQGCEQHRDAPIGPGWVHIDSEETADRFYGTRVELHAPAKHHPRWGLHCLHGQVVVVSRHHINAWCLSLNGGEDGLCWRARGNVYLRPVSE